MTGVWSGPTLPALSFPRVALGLLQQPWQQASGEGGGHPAQPVPPGTSSRHRSTDAVFVVTGPVPL